MAKLLFFLLFFTTVSLTAMSHSSPPHHHHHHHSHKRHSPQKPLEKPHQNPQQKPIQNTSQKPYSQQKPSPNPSPSSSQKPQEKPSPNPSRNPQENSRRKPFRNPIQNPFGDAISTLFSTPDFQTWATLLSLSTPPMMNLTLFIPSDTALSHLPTYFDPLLLPYHIVPHKRLSYLQLRSLPTNFLIPTLLPDHSLIITNSSSSEFTLNNVRFSRPDLFLSDSVAVHGIRNVFHYSFYGDGNRTSGFGFGLAPEGPRRKRVPREEAVWWSGADNGIDRFSVIFWSVVFTDVVAIFGLYEVVS